MELAVILVQARRENALSQGDVAKAAAGGSRVAVCEPGNPRPHPHLVRLAAAGRAQARAGAMGAVLAIVAQH